MGMIQQAEKIQLEQAKLFESVKAMADSFEGKVGCHSLEVTPKDGQPLPQEATLASRGMKADAKSDFILQRRPFDIYVRTLTGKILTFDAEPSSTIDNLKARIME